MLDDPLFEPRQLVDDGKLRRVALDLPAATPAAYRAVMELAMVLVNRVWVKRGGKTWRDSDHCTTLHARVPLLRR